MRKKKEKDMEIKNEQLIKLIILSDKDLNTIAKENNLSFEEFESLINEFHKSLDLKLESDKKERKEVKDSYLAIEKGLEKLRKEAESINLPDRDFTKNYAQVFDGEKWI